MNLKPIALIKNIIATISTVVLWPYKRLATKLTRASRSSVRWAARRRNVWLYFGIALSPLIFMGAIALYALIGAAITIKLTFFAIVTFFNKGMFTLLVALKGWDRAWRAKFHWRRRNRPRKG